MLDKNILTGNNPNCISSESVIELIRQLETNQFWGSVKLYFQAGHLVQGEVSQTVKQLVSEQNLLIIVQS